MSPQERIHREAHQELRVELEALGLHLADHIPWCWRELQKLESRGSAARRWASAIHLIVPLVADGELLDGKPLLSQLVGKECVVDSIPRDAERRLTRRIRDLPKHRLEFTGRPGLGCRVLIGNVPGLADARRKTAGGMLRRYTLKQPELAQLDALAAWVVVEGERSGERCRIPAAVTQHLRGLGYKEVGNLKTDATSDTYEAATFQRTQRIAGIDVGGEVKIFTVDQFRNAEIDPCSDSARSRYERRRLLQLAQVLGFPGTTVHFVRHGRTTGNKDDILHGWTDTRLLSEEEPETSGFLFSAKHASGLQAIYSSDLERAARTSELFAGPFDITPILLPGLRERHLGVHEGQPRPVGKEGHKFFQAFGANRPVPGGEAFKGMAARVLLTTQMAVEHHIDSEVMVFTHAGPLRALLGGIDGVPAEIQWDIASPPHLKVTTRFIPKGYLAHVFNQLFGSAKPGDHVGNFLRRSPRSAPGTSPRL